MYILQNSISPMGKVGRPVAALFSINNLTIPFDPANTDYQKFKADVLAGAELQDANGKILTKQQALDFLATLP